METCIRCGSPVPEGRMCCPNCDAAIITLKQPPKANTELSFGGGDGEYDFLVCYHRAKPLNKFQIWMYKVCFGMRVRNI